MSKRKQKIEFHQIPKDYNALCAILPPRTIRDSIDFQNVTEITDSMAGHDLSSDQEDYFDLLCRLIQDWESTQVAPTKATGIDVLRHLLESHGLSAADLARILNVHRTLGAMILRGERSLTLKHIKVLSKYFRVGADCFLD